METFENNDGSRNFFKIAFNRCLRVLGYLGQKLFIEIDTNLIVVNVTLLPALLNVFQVFLP